MGSGKQGSKPAFSAASTAWKARFLPIVYHAFCEVATILHKPYIIWFRRYLRAHSPQSRRSSDFDKHLFITHRLPRLLKGIITFDREWDPVAHLIQGCDWGNRRGGACFGESDSSRCSITRP
jgi:hypothetical protein